MRFETTRDAWMRRAALTALLMPAILLAAAFASQLFGLVACEMCWWQRWAHIYALPSAATALLIMTTRLSTVAQAMTAARLWTFVASFCILGSGLIGIYHAGVEYHLWQGHTACTANMPKGLTGSEFLHALMNQPMIRCDTAQWTLFGVSLAGWNALISISTAATIWWMLWRGRKTA